MATVEAFPMRTCLNYCLFLVKHLFLPPRPASRGQRVQKVIVAGVEWDWTRIHLQSRLEWDPVVVLGDPTDRDEGNAFWAMLSRCRHGLATCQHAGTWLKQEDMQTRVFCGD